MNQLEQARITIDAIDSQMAALFEQRMAAVCAVADYKAERGLPIYDAEREKQVLAKNTARITDPALRPYYADLLQHQMDLAKAFEAYRMGRDRVAYQGVEGAFAHIAATRLFPHAKAVNCATWEAVFAAVEQDEAAYGVLPFENSHAGDVSAVLDLCYAHNLSIVQVYDLPVVQNLLGVPGAQLNQIKTVYSHPQAITQSEQFLRSFGLPAVAMDNTAMAARYVAQSGDATLAAIASEETAALYGLQVLVPGINTDGDNTTRFVVVGKELPADGNRFSLLFTVDNKPGKLARAVECIGASGFNMECIKSRPMPRVPFEYYFYVELEGSPKDEATARLLTQLEGICRTVRVLGVYTK